MTTVNRADLDFHSVKTRKQLLKGTIDSIGNNQRLYIQHTELELNLAFVYILVILTQRKDASNTSRCFDAVGSENESGGGHRRRTCHERERLLQS